MSRLQMRAAAKRFAHEAGLDREPGTTYQIRHSIEMMATWKAAALADGRTLQEWIRHMLNEAAKR